MTREANLLFSRIKGRLTYYTIEMYKNHPGEGVDVEQDIDGHLNNYFHVTDEVYALEKNSNTIDTIEFYEYLDSIIEGFREVRKKISINDFVSVYKHRGHSLKKLQQNVYNKHEFELDLILSKLDSLRKRYKKKYNAAKKAKVMHDAPQKIEIDFNNEFKLESFQGVFHHQISNEEAALFFLYLAQEKFIPDYTAIRKAELAFYLFGVEKQGTRKLMGQKKGFLNTKSNLQKIKDLFDKLSSSAEADLKKLNRPSK